MPALILKILEEIIMKFINHLKENNKLDKVTAFNASSLRAMNHIKVKNKVTLSIQSGYGMYCSPRKNLDNLEDYTSMEFALLDESGEFISADIAFPKYTKLEELAKYYEGMVYAYVPVELIEDFYFHVREGI